MFVQCRKIQQDEALVMDEYTATVARSLAGNVIGSSATTARGICDMVFNNLSGVVPRSTTKFFKHSVAACELEE